MTERRGKFIRTVANQPAAAGQEVLVVDADDQVVKGLDRLLTQAGLIVTGTHDPVRARDQLLNKFYAVALVDADTPTPGGGIELLQFARDKSPLTSVMIMTARKSYETAVKAFRAGAVDVVLKEPDVVPYLRERVIEAAGELQATADRNSLLEEVAETHEEFLRRMREMSHELLDHGGPRPRARTSDERPTSAAVSVVLVDDDPEALEKLEKRAHRDGRVALPRCAHGRRGAGRRDPDAASDRHRQGAPAGSAREHGGHSREGERPGRLTLLYSPPGASGRTGEVKMIDAEPGHEPGGELQRAPEQLVGRLNEIREALQQKAKERRYLQAFRQRNFEFLQRYNGIKTRLKEELDRRKKNRLGS